MSARLPCLVPFCRRTRRNDGRFSEWVCWQHWRLVDRRWRALYATACRRHRRHFADPRWHRIESYIWDHCKRQALERATGITA